MFADVFYAGWHGTGWAPDVAQWQRCSDRFEAVWQRCPEVPDVIMQAELQHLYSQCRWCLDHALAKRGARSVDGLGARLAELIAEHQQVWVLRSLPGGLADSCRRWQNVAAQLPPAAWGAVPW